MQRFCSLPLENNDYGQMKSIRLIICVLCVCVCVCVCTIHYEYVYEYYGCNGITAHRIHIFFFPFHFNIYTSSLYVSVCVCLNVFESKVAVVLGLLSFNNNHLLSFIHAIIEY